MQLKKIEKNQFFESIKEKQIEQEKKFIKTMIILRLIYGYKKINK